jgi:FkbM family methyltransferase
MKHKIFSFFLALAKVLFSPRQSKKSYSQFGEDCALFQVLGGRKMSKGFYVDVGCHHPRKGSNTYFLYKKGWRGVLVDLELSKIYACKILRPSDTVVLAAVSDKEEEVEVFSPRQFSVMTSIQNNNKSDNRVIAKMITKTLTSVLDSTKYKNKEIDLLSVDVEGVDFQVLKGLDFLKYNPKVVVVETWVDDIDGILQGDINCFLYNKGYRLTNWVGLSLIYQKD